ncbi:hypothetical protein D3C85_1364180 [compost metagenome]
MWAWKKVSLIQATPNTEKMATMPALKTAPLAISPGLTLQRIRMMAPAISIIIWITRFMESGPVFSLMVNTGRNPSLAPSNTTAAMAAKKIQVDQ